MDTNSMWQKCPVCNGLGTIGERWTTIYSQPPLPNENIDNKVCHVCNGHGIISVISGMPPVHTKQRQKD